MIFSVYYNVPNEAVAYRIDSYDITEPHLYIPKFLLLKMTELCNKKNKYMLKNDNDIIILNYLIQGFKHLNVIDRDINELYIWNVIDKFLLLANVNTMTELYNKMITPDDTGYAVFSVLDEVD
jgi:hypothetical protein